MTMFTVMFMAVVEMVMVAVVMIMVVVMMRVAVIVMMNMLMVMSTRSSSVEGKIDPLVEEPDTDG